VPRSRWHRVILSFSLAPAFGLAIFFAKAPELRQEAHGIGAWRHENGPTLLARIVTMGVAVPGARVVFSMLLDITFTEPHTKPRGGIYPAVARAEEVLELLVAP
jgi:hypothetical protein